MKTAYKSSCLLLLLLAVCVSNTNAGGAISDPCTTVADCTFTKARCTPIDECTKGVCTCISGYTGVSNVCKALKKIGETCNDSTDKCYDGSCTANVCVCGSGQATSGDKKSCGRMFGESCTTNSQCKTGMKCLTSKCGCDTDKKRVVLNYFIKLVDDCAHKDATLDVLPNGACDNNYISANGKVCRSDLYCGSCPEDTSGSNKKCLSGANELSASKLALGVLVLAAIFMKRH